MSSRHRVVVFASERSYTRSELASGATELGIELVWATDRCHVLAQEWPAGAIAIDPRDVDGAVSTVLDALGDRPVAAAIGTDEPTASLAAALSVRLGLAHHDRDAATRAGDKLAFRAALTAARCPQPRFVEVAWGATTASLPLPLVVKPRCLSASRGVMRADSPAELAARLDRLWRLLDDPEVRGVFGDAASSAVVETFVPGSEVAFEGILRAGHLETIALFDKPDPLDGPFFAETLYVTPSELPAPRQTAIARAVSAAAVAIGLTDGPVHAELRVAEGEPPVVIELAARSIGGLCGRTLRIACGHSVEAIVLAGLCGIELELAAPQPAGVLMIPVREAGVLLEVDGVDAARDLAGVDDVVITMPLGTALEPLPERGDYIGFAFARGETPAQVTATLRQASELLRPRIRPRLTPA